MLVTESQSGDAPKPNFSMKTDETSEKSRNQGQINHRNLSLFLSLNSRGAQPSKGAWEVPIAHGALTT